MDNFGQQIKGHAQQVKGKIKNATGNHGDGAVDIIKGKANVAIGKIKNKV